MMEFAFANKFESDPSYMVCVDCDGESAAAYLVKDNRIISEVLLYCAASDDESELAVMDFKAPESPEDLDICWFRMDGQVQALLYIGDELHATLVSGDSVGRCRLARKDTTEAKVLQPLF